MTIEFSHFETAFSASTTCVDVYVCVYVCVCVCVCVFILPAGRHAMLLLNANTGLNVGSGHSSTKYNMKCFSHGSLRDTFHRFANVNHDLTTQPVRTINNYHWFTDPNVCMQYIGIFQRW